MKKNATRSVIGFLFLALIIAGLTYWMQQKPDQPEDIIAAAKKAAHELKESSGEEEEGREEHENEIRTKKERQEYFFRMLRDPATNSIPEHIRSRELRHARQVPTMLELKRRMKSKNPTTQVAEGFNWRLAGPPAVGGRTRALGIDGRNSNIIIAGGVSGGIWKSTDGGESWQLKTPDFDNFSVTSLAQDPTNPDTWYYVAGEIIGNSASGRNRSAPYYGTGVFRSTDNGETWSRISGTEDADTQFDSQFDYVHRVAVSPTTGTVFIASNGLGILRSPNGNNFDDLTLGGFGEHYFADVAVASDGRIVGVLSSTEAGASGGNPGIFVSDDDGQTWDEITPSSFPDSYDRSVLAIAPSDPNIIYVFTDKSGDDSNQGVSFYKLDLSGNPEDAKDRAENLPDFGDPVGGLNLQGGYNMTVAVKSDDPNFVTLGGTNLFRSTDGFATAPDDNSQSEKNKYWIGGYAKANDISQYPNQHADQQVQVYDPNNPDKLWVGNDGGVYMTTNDEANSVSWNDQNDGYVVTQFYDASIATKGGDNRFMGGTQDNGTPFFAFEEEGNTDNAAADISSGDGGFSFFTNNYIYVSNAQGSNENSRLIRFNGDFSGDFAFVQPSQAQTAYFISPYAIDPNDEGTMYFPGGKTLYRNTKVDEITNQNSDGTTQDWEALDAASLTSPYAISALSVSTVPQNILYYAGSDNSIDGNSVPVIKRLDNASTSSAEPTDISIPDASAGAFVHDIAINPTNANDVLVVMSNYNIVGLYHTSDGGSSWKAVEGNLTGINQPTSSDAGPSIRSATIVPSESGPIYLLGTSTGVYATQNLDGDNTEWGHESSYDNNGIADIGFSVVENITSRFSDGDVAVGTHGRGMFVGRFQGTVAAADIPIISINPTEARAGKEITITATNFQFSSNPDENEVYFGDIQAEVVEASPSQITVIVPRATLDPMSDDRSIFVKVINANGADPQAQSFTVLPPIKNDLGQSFPNPFSMGDNMRIPISLINPSNLTLQIYDISGRLIDKPLEGEKYQAGTYNISVNFSGKASGIYIYRLIAKPTNKSDTFVDSKKFTYIK